MQIGDTCRLTDRDAASDYTTTEMPEIVLYAGTDKNFSLWRCASPEIRNRLDFLRGELRAERISQEELLELQDLAAYIEPGDVELLEPAGVPEGRAYLANEDCVRIFYEISNVSEFVEAFVPLRLLEPAPHHLGDDLRAEFFGHDTETRRYLTQRRSKGRKKP